MTGRQAPISPSTTALRAPVGVAEAGGELLRGRSLNGAYRVRRGGQDLLVKVHRPQPDDLAVSRLEAVDTLLRGRPWYPPLVDIGWRDHGSGAELVVIRPYVEGATLATTGDVAALVGVLGELAQHGEGSGVHVDLVSDYASGWLAEPQAAIDWVMAAGPALADRVVPHLEGLLAAARRSTVAARMVQHGDLHEYNLVRGPGGALSVIDWDDAGFSDRPADCARAMWFAGRVSRRGFKLHRVALERFLRAVEVWVPFHSAIDLARLGAMSFLPRPGYVEGLREQDPEMAAWYADWAIRYWSAFEENLDVVSTVAERL